jgi:hypothetical protein
LALLAQHSAERFGEPNPTDLEAVTGLDAKPTIERLGGMKFAQPMSGAVDVIQVSGSFNVPGPPPVPGGPNPTNTGVSGQVETIVVDKATGRVVLTGITKAANRPDISGLGGGNPVPLQPASGSGT